MTCSVEGEAQGSVGRGDDFSLISFSPPSLGLEAETGRGGLRERARKNGSRPDSGRAAKVGRCHGCDEEGAAGIVCSRTSSSVRLQRYTVAYGAWSDDQRATRQQNVGRYMVAIMNEALDLKPGLQILEAGAGSGYHAATIAEQIGPTGHVYTIELVMELVEFARKNLDSAGYSDRVTLVQGDGSLGYKDRAPYDRILVTAAAPRVPDPLLEQLRPQGILLVPVGGRLFPQELVKVEKDADGHFKKASLGGVAFVPLIGKEGFDA